jgi:hypothetical protein
MVVTLPQGAVVLQAAPPSGGGGGAPAVNRSIASHRDALLGAFD